MKYKVLLFITLIFCTPLLKSTAQEVDWKLPYIPETLTFAGEKVPLDNPDVRERLMRELIVQKFKHGSTYQIMMRAQFLEPIMKGVLRENGVSEDFFYLAAIESDLKPDAVSSKDAVGYWQFLKGTAREYDLTVTDYVDQRKDILQSTRAAAEYFKSAEKLLGSWALAAAAFNRGRTGVVNAIKVQNVKNYYNLYLNSETARYVYRILAMKLIMENPGRYGYEKLPLKTIDFKEIPITENIKSWPIWAQKRGSNYKILKKYNAWIDNPDYSLQMPKNTKLTVYLPRGDEE